MTKLYISEFSKIASDANGNVLHFPGVPDVVQSPVTYSGTSAASAAFASTTSVVRVHVDSICCIVFGTNPTATTSHQRMVAGQTEYFAVTPGSAMKIAAITTT